MKNSIREQLGITQEDLALLLQITRSQLSLYELGKRDLPIVAKLKLAAMLLHVQTATNESKNDTSKKDIQINEKKKIIEELLFLNKRKQQTLYKKINAIIKKQKANEVSLHLFDFLNSKVKNISNEQKLVKGIETKVKNSFIKNNEQAQFKLQIQKEGLEAQQKHFENILKKL